MPKMPHRTFSSYRVSPFVAHVASDLATPTLVKQGNYGNYARGAKFALRNTSSS